MKWLFLRGLLRESRHWGDFPALFEAATGDEAQFLDLPGFGTRQSEKSPSSVRGIRECVRKAWLDQRKPGEEWGILALSLGGMIAMDWTSAHPEDFSRQVLINTSSSDTTPPWQRFAWSQIPRVLRILASKHPIDREIEILGLTSRRHASNRALAESWAQFSPSKRIFLEKGLAQLAAAARFKKPKNLGCQTLVLVSQHDGLASPQNSYRMSYAYGCELRAHLESGHDLPLDDPQWVADQVKNWLKDPSRG